MRMVRKHQRQAPRLELGRMNIAVTGPADLRDERRLGELEAVVERGLASFVEVGEALLEIRGSRLYRLSHGTFEDYCRERWGFSRQHAARLMDASEVVGLVSPSGDNPTTLEHARELAPLKDQPAVLRDVWAGVIERAERDETPITGPVIRNAVRDRIRGMAADSEAELQGITATWTDEQRDAVSPEMMRQRGELLRLIHAINALPQPDALASQHYLALRKSGGFIGEATHAAAWLEAFCTILEEKR